MTHIYVYTSLLHQFSWDHNQTQEVASNSQKPPRSCTACKN